MYKRILTITIDIMNIKSIFLLYVCLTLTYGNEKTIFEP